MEAAWTALQPGILSGHNAGFLRDGASLAVIVYDPDAFLEDDGSPQATDYYLNFFSSLKGGNSQLVSVSLMYVGAYYVPHPTLGTRYTALTKGSDGLLIDTTGANWSAEVSQLWTAATGSLGALVLSGTPVPSSIQVWLDGPPSGPGVAMPGLQIQQMNANGSANWQYIASTNTLLINSQNVGLGSSDTVYVVYALACG
jgi:hypothetical protein